MVVQSAKTVAASLAHVVKGNVLIRMKVTQGWFRINKGWLLNVLNQCKGMQF